jgi:hypothetical protein
MIGRVIVDEQLIFRFALMCPSILFYSELSDEHMVLKPVD